MIIPDENYIPKPVVLDDQSGKVMDLLVLGMAIGALARMKKIKGQGGEPKAVQQDVFNAALSRAATRLLPGAKLVRAGRPMVDLSKKIKKQQRRALNAEYFKYRKGVKAAAKKLISDSRGKAQSAYK